MKRLLILIFFLAPPVFSIDHNVFKDCSRVPFCTKFRNQVVDDNLQFSADISKTRVDDFVVTIPLSNLNGDNLDLHISFLNGSQIRIKIVEPDHSRYELVDVLDKEPTVSSLTSTMNADENVNLISSDDSNLYVIVTSGLPFSVQFYYNDILEIVLSGDRFVIENTDSSQAFSFGVNFVGASKLYGLHHHAYHTALRETADGSSDPFRLRNCDAAYYEIDSTMALYGAVPVVYGHSSEITSGVFLHNAAEQWVDISYTSSNPSAYFMVGGGALDLFVLLGPTPKEVVRQFTDLTGVAHLPQLWTLGYHQCRFSYQSQEDVKDVVANMDNYDFPMDAIWLDIDYTDGKQYFTWNLNNFNDPVEMQTNLSSTNRKLVTIIDPHIKVDDNYNVYAGAKENYFVKWADGSNFEGQCWPGLSSYLDFLNPEARDYYASWYSYEKFPYTTETLAGIWNDMNEPSVFDLSDAENTLPFETIHNGNVLHRDVHNIYGLLHTKATHQGLMQRDNNSKRPFVLTRSHFAGSQRYAAMWTGDNQSDWPYLAISYPECMTSNILGMVFCGADVGGFFNNPGEQLLQRWYQAAIWLPFFRGHSVDTADRREPYLFPDNVQTIIRKAIKLRYKHISYWYTLFYEHTRYGDPVIRPLFYNYPDIFERDDHVLVGTDILARPVLEADVTSIEVFLPGSDTYWYRIDDDSWSVHKGNEAENIAVDITTSPFYYKAGSVILRKDNEARSTADMQDDHYTLYINLDANNNAAGRFYLDDFTSFKYSTENAYFYATFTYVPETQGVYIEAIDGNSDGFVVTLQQIIVHRIIEDTRYSSRTVYNTTKDGTPLHTINIVKNINSRKLGGLTLLL